jgi:hypothetical protein
VLREPKLSNFKIGGSILQNDENRGTKTAIKPNNNNNNVMMISQPSFKNINNYHSGILDE